MAITLTESAAARVKSYMVSEADHRALRLGVRTTGCSGYAYVVDLVDEVTGDDHVFESQGVTIVVDEKSISLVDGTCIDFREDGLSATFAFHNPNVKGECGCGESFSVG